MGDGKPNPEVTRGQLFKSRIALTQKSKKIFRQLVLNLKKISTEIFSGSKAVLFTVIECDVEIPKLKRPPLKNCAVQYFSGRFT